MHITKSTPNRKTKILWDAFTPVVVQPYFAIERAAGQMRVSKPENNTNCEYVPGIGWRLRSHQSDPHTLWESENQPALPPGTLAPGVISSFFFHPEAFTGVSYTGAANPGMPLNQKQIAAGGSWDNDLTADSAAFPGPNAFNAIASFDRQFVSDDNHLPKDGVSFVFAQSSSGVSITGPLASFYFSGPAGTNSALRGFGQYCLACFGSGTAVLYERGFDPDDSTIWAERFRFVYAQHVPGMLHNISVRSNASETCGRGWAGDTITFGMMSYNDIQTGSPAFMLNSALVATAQLDIGLSAKVFRVPGPGKATCTPEKARVDVRRDVRALFNLYYATYPTSGTLIEDSFTLPFVATEAEPMRLEWFGDAPGGTTLTAKLYSIQVAGDTEITTEIPGVVEIDDCLGQAIRFDLLAGRYSTFQIKYEFTGDGSTTPTLSSEIAYRSAVMQDSTSTAFSLPNCETGLALPRSSIERLDLKGPTENPGEETASIDIVDFVGDNPEIKIKSGTPIDVAIYDDSDVLVSYLHRGIIAAVRSENLSKRGADYPLDSSFKATIQTQSEMARIKRKFNPCRITLFDKSAGKPYKITDAMKMVLQDLCSYPESMIDIPDLPLRFLGGEEDISIEPGVNLDRLLTGWAHDYLGAYLIFDRNAGTYGMWRLMLRKYAPYNVLWRFTPEHPGDLILPHVMDAYGTSTGVGGQEIIHLPMLKSRGSRPQVRIEPPEGNVVSVYGSSINGSDHGSIGVANFSQIAVNFNSVNMLGLADDDSNAPDPNSPDYLREAVMIEYRDPALGKQEAVNWVCRRLYDSAVYARKYYTFETFWGLTTVDSDPHQTLPRGPQFYDMCEVWEGESWVPYVVVQASPRYTKSGMMMADIQLVTSTAIQNSHANPISMASAYKVEQFLRQLASQRANGLYNSRGAPTRTSQKSMSINQGGLAVMPVVAGAPIQDWDPSSPTFGEFFYMADYDPVP